MARFLLPDGRLLRTSDHKIVESIFTRKEAQRLYDTHWFSRRRRLQFFFAALTNSLELHIFSKTAIPREVGLFMTTLNNVTHEQFHLFRDFESFLDKVAIEIHHPKYGAIGYKSLSPFTMKQLYDVCLNRARARRISYRRIPQTSAAGMLICSPPRGRGPLCPYGCGLCHLLPAR